MTASAHQAGNSLTTSAASHSSSQGLCIKLWNIESSIRSSIDNDGQMSQSVAPGRDEKGIRLLPVCPSVLGRSILQWRLGASSPPRLRFSVRFVCVHVVPCKTKVDSSPFLCIGLRTTTPLFIAVTLPTMASYERGLQGVFAGTEGRKVCDHILNRATTASSPLASSMSLQTLSVSPRCEHATVALHKNSMSTISPALPILAGESLT